MAAKKSKATGRIRLTAAQIHDLDLLRASLTESLIAMSAAQSDYEAAQEHLRRCTVQLEARRSASSTAEEKLRRRMKALLKESGIKDTGQSWAAETDGDDVYLVVARPEEAD